MYPKPDKIRILIIEDDVKVALSLRDILEAAGYAVEIVDTRSRAFYLLRNKIFDVALIDLQLRDDVTHKGGISVIKEINRLNEGTTKIVITATSEVRDAKASYDQGISAFLMKDSFHMKDILDEIEKALNINHRRSFGGFPSLLSYLAAPDSGDFLEDKIRDCIKCPHDSVQKVLWKSLSPHFPILRAKDGGPSFELSQINNAVSGMFWSKVEGCAIWFSAANKKEKLVEPRAGQQQELISNIESIKGVECAVWRLPGIDRSDFLDCISDTPWDAKKKK